uniref:Uncharacterized protein n=1 Tax=Amphimedon queenslandica TaxID=400682 RepID=A0A1X7V7V8_AMPQE
MFHALAPTKKSHTLESCYRDNELKKKGKYELRVKEVEHSSFIPRIFSTLGGSSPFNTSFLKRLSSTQRSLTDTTTPQ